MQMLPNEIRFRDPIAIAECLLYRDSEDIKSMMKLNNIHFEDIGVLDDLANGTNSFSKTSVCCRSNGIGEICKCSNCLENPGDLCPALMAVAGHSYNAENSTWSENNSNANMNEFVNKLIQSQDDIPRELAGLSLSCGLVTHSVVNSFDNYRNNGQLTQSPAPVSTPELSDQPIVLLSHLKASDELSQLMLEKNLSTSDSASVLEENKLESQSRMSFRRSEDLHQDQTHHHSSAYGDTNIYFVESSPSKHINSGEQASPNSKQFIHQQTTFEDLNKNNTLPSDNQASNEKKELSCMTSVNVSTSSSGSEFSIHSIESNRGSPLTPTIAFSKPLTKVQVTRASSVLPRCNSFDYPSFETNNQWQQMGPMDDLVLSQIQRLQPTPFSAINNSTNSANNSTSSFGNAQASWQFRPIKPQVDSGISKVNLTDNKVNSRASPATILKSYSSNNTGPPIVAPIPLHLIAPPNSSNNLSQNQSFLRGPTPHMASCWTVLQTNNTSGNGDMNNVGDQSQSGITFTHHPAQSAFKTGRQSGVHSVTATPTRDPQSNIMTGSKHNTVTTSTASNVNQSGPNMISLGGQNIQQQKFTKHYVQTPQSGYLIIPAGYLTSHQNGSSPILVAAPSSSNSSTNVCSKPPMAAHAMKVNLVAPPSGSMQIQRMSGPSYSVPSKTSLVTSSSSATATVQSTSLSSATKLNNAGDDTASELILISSNTANVENQTHRHQLQLVPPSAVSSLNSNNPTVSAAQQHPILNLAQPQQYRINSKRSQAAMELHTKFELLVEQHRLLENDRKKTEAELIRQNPGKKISHMSNNNLTKNTKDNTRVDKELNSILTNHSRVVNLISKMEKLRNDPLPSNIHSAMDCWLEGIRKCQARRKEEMVNSTNRARCGGPRHQDDKDMLALSQSLSELCQHTRRARTSLWAALQMTDKEQATSLQQALNHLAQLASYSIQSQTNNSIAATNNTTKHSNMVSTSMHISSSSSCKFSSAQHQSTTTDSLANSHTPSTHTVYNRGISLQSSASPSQPTIHQSQQQNASRIVSSYQNVNSGPKIVFSTAPAPTVGGGGHTLTYQHHHQGNFPTLSPGPGLYSMYYTCTPSGATPQTSGPISYAHPHITHHPNHPHQLM